MRMARRPIDAPPKGKGHRFDSCRARHLRAKNRSRGLITHRLLGPVMAKTDPPILPANVGYEG